MSQNPTKSYDARACTRGPDTETLEAAAAMLWEDRLTDEEIAQSLGVSRRTLARWKLRPDLEAMVAVHRERWRASLKPYW